MSSIACALNGSESSTTSIRAVDPSFVMKACGSRPASSTRSAASCSRGPMVPATPGCCSISACRSASWSGFAAAPSRSMRTSVGAMIPGAKPAAASSAACRAAASSGSPSTRVKPSRTSWAW